MKILLDECVPRNRGVEYEQNPIGRKISLIIFRAKSNRLRDLQPYTKACLARLSSIRPGEVVRILAAEVDR